jgi:hypothetical protein
MTFSIAIPKNYLFLLAISWLIVSCDSKPKIIVEDVSPADTTQTAIATDPNAAAPAVANDVHQVQVIESLHTDRYTYMRVLENTDTFWIAATKMDVKKGEKYLYRGGLMKTNFFSQEFNRTFDKVYLVSNIISASEHPGGNMAGSPAEPTGDVQTTGNSSFVAAKGSLSLDKLFKNKTSYAGKSVIVSGKVVKVNSGIMNRNWVHIQDGTNCKDKKCDITITTSENILLGSEINMEGKVVLDKDFGAGYKYDLILEEGKVVK